MTLDSKSRSSSNLLKIYILAHNAISSFTLWPRALISGTTIAYVALMTCTFSNQQYDLGVKGQCQIYLKSFIQFVT